MIPNLFLFFLKLGFVSVGGGYPMMSFIMQEGQKALGLTAGEFADMAALELLASGPIAINAATYIGYIKGGFLGAVVATAGVCLPSFILTALLYAFLARFKENKYVQAFIQTIKVACAGVLFTTAATLAKNILLLTTNRQALLRSPLVNISWGSVLIVGFGVVAIQKFKVSPIAVIFAAALAGVFLF